MLAYTRIRIYIMYTFTFHCLHQPSEHIDFILYTSPHSTLISSFQ